MNAEKLSKRLEKVARFVPKGARLADIGSDHAYLPVYLVKTGRIDFAVAGEVVEGPFKSAQAEVERQGLSDKISVRLANGLAAVESSDQIDTVTICGMGGQLISEILVAEEEKLVGISRLILQPNIGERGLRLWLNAHGFKITDEAILKENGKIYEIIIATHGKQTLTAQERLLGPVLMQAPNAVFYQKWSQELANKRRVLAKLRQAKRPIPAKIAQFEQEVRWISEVINEN